MMSLNQSVCLSSFWLGRIFCDIVGEDMTTTQGDDYGTASNFVYNSPGNYLSQCFYEESM